MTNVEFEMLKFGVRKIVEYFTRYVCAKGDITNYVWATRDELDRLIDQNQKKMEEKSRFNWIRLNFHSSVLILWHLDVSVAITPIYAMRSFHFDQLFEPSCPILNCIWFLLSNIEDWSRMIVVTRKKPIVSSNCSQNGFRVKTNRL